MADSRKSKIFKTYLSRMNTIKKDKYAAELFAALETGKNSYMRIDRLESSNFDMVWINRIEDCIYELGEIIANPKEVTKTVTGIVPVELARKTGAESVQHLASHTQYIKEITEEGDVVPNKILNIGSEEDIHTYENRFIATLVRRLVLFIEKRYEFIKKFSTLHDEEILFYKTKAIVDGSEVEIETKIKVKSESDSESANMSNNYVNRIMKLREYIMYFYGSKFMKELKTERDVRNPIVMTNILRKNPKYHKCYELFRFVEKYDKLGVSYKLDEDASIFTDEELSELNTVMFTNYLALKAKDRSKITKGFSRVYKPRILTSIDDEQFIYGDLLRGPIEFLRVDEDYQKYLDEQLRQDLPPRPTKIEKEYYEEELAARNARKAEKAALDKLAKRKKKEQAEYERQVRAIVAQREKEEAERRAREAEVARTEEERRIEEVRQALIRDALFGSDTNPESEEGDSPVLETPVVEEPVNEEPVEEEINEEPTEEVQEPVEEEVVPEETQPSEESEAVEEEPQVEEPVEEIPEDIEDTLEEEDLTVLDEPVEEVPQEVEEEPAPEVIEEVAEEPAPAPEEASESDIDAIRQQLIADALSEEEPEPVQEPVVEEPQPEEIPQESEEEIAPEVVEEVPEVNEEPIEEETSEEEIPEEVEEHEDNNDAPKKPFIKPIRSSDSPKGPRYIKVGNKHRKEKKSEEEIQDEVEEPEDNNGAPKKPFIKPIRSSDSPKGPRYIKVGNKHRKEKKSEEGEEAEGDNNAPKKPFVKPVHPSDVHRGPRYIKVGNKRKKEHKEIESVEEPEEVEIQEPNEGEEPIPGKFIVKTNEGYYVSEGQFSIHKHEAFVFDDFNEANSIKKAHGGKVVKL